MNNKTILRLWKTVIVNAFLGKHKNFFCVLDKGYLSCLGIGRWFSFQRFVIRDSTKNERSTFECRVGIGSIEAGYSLEHHGNASRRN